MKLYQMILLFGAVIALSTLSVHAEEGAAEEGEETEEESDTHDGFSKEDQAALSEGSEKHEFQAEVSRLMDIIINSLYSNKEIFLRELISNASDALDKIRFLSVTDESALGEVTDLDVKITIDKERKLLSITDKGCGMSKQDLVNNLGTVARSGTSGFLEAVAKGGDLSLIGQFGVGFYSVYLVADHVTVVSKANDDKQYVWESSADATFTVAEDPRGDTLGRGTQVTLHLKEDAEEFLEVDKMRELVRKYSEFITFPIMLEVTKTVDKEVPLEEGDEGYDDGESEKKEEDGEKDEKDDDIDVSEEEDAEKSEEDKPKTKTISEEVKEWERLNENKAIWTRSKDDVEESEYQDFYKAISKDSDNPLSYIHFSAEGEIEFRSILYIPATAPYDLYDNYYQKSTSLKLYVRRVLITDTFEDLMPRYLSFVKGVVDSDDLPLNVSREMLQQHKVLKVMGKKLVRKALEMLKQLAGKEDKADYNKFWEQFGKSIKMGIMEDSSNRSKLAKLMRFKTSKSDEEWTSFDDYVERMKEGQKGIYYAAGNGRAEIVESPFLEKLEKKGYEVIYFTDPVDEYCLGSLTEYDDKKLINVAKEKLEFGDEDGKDKKLEEHYKAEFEETSKWLKEVYGEKVEKVIVSNRLENSPAVLVTSQYGYTANMERIMKAQTLGKETPSYMSARKTLEINPRHPIIVEINNRAKDEEKKEESSTKDLANLVLDMTILQSGFAVEDKKDFAERLSRTIAIGLNVDPEAELAAEPELPEDEEPAAEEEESVEEENLDEEEKKEEL